MHAVIDTIFAAGTTLPLYIMVSMLSVYVYVFRLQQVQEVHKET